MIYFVTNQEFIPKTFGITLATEQDVFKYLESKSEVGLDTETEGFDPYTNKLLLLQIGDEEDQFVIDATTVDVTKFKKSIESLKRIIIHNAKFDLKFLFHKNIIPFKNIFDTYLAERVLSLGLKSHRKSLAACVDRYLKVTLSKEVRGLIHQLGVLNERVIRYAADDVKYLITLKNSQCKALEEKDLNIVMSLENEFVEVITYMEYCGVYLDKNKWIEKSEKDQYELNKIIKVLDDFVINELKNYKYMSPPDLFNPNYTCKLNWNSPTQLIPFFEELGLDLTIYDKGEIKKSIGVDVLQPQVKIHPIVEIFIEFQKLKKLTSTYGIDFIKHINPVTNRIHTNFNQIMNTGRLSSGKNSDRDSNREDDALNLQNIPKGIERECFVPEDGNDLIVADYSGQETRVLAEFSDDEEFSKYISDPEKDLHCLMASIIFPELRQYSHKEIESNFSDKRQFAKAATFAIPYGGDGTTLSDNLGISKDEGDRIYKEYLDTFPGLKNYFDMAKRQVLSDGYVMINNVSKRKSYIPYFEQFKVQRHKMDNNFWEMYRIEKEKNSDIFLTELKPFVSKYFSKKSEIERIGLNFRIQGTSADITKVAGIYLYNWIVKNGLWGVVKINIQLHDEWMLECPKELSGKVKDILSDSMIRAAKVFCETIPFKAVAVISDHWKH